MSLQFLETTLFRHSLFREAGGSYKRNSSLIDIALALPVSGTAEIRTRTPFRMEGLANLSDNRYSTIPFRVLSSSTIPTWGVEHIQHYL